MAATAATASLLPTALQTSLDEIVHRSNQRGAACRAILLSTTDGVPLGRAMAKSSTVVAESSGNGNNNADTVEQGGEQPGQLQEEILASIESVWAPASKQLPLLGLDKAKEVVAIYDHGTLVHVYQSALVITILCGPQSNLGAVRSTTIPHLKIVLEPLEKQLVKALQPEADGSTAYYQ